jgi:hypothetical protein
VIESPDGRLMDSIITSNGESIPASCFMDIAYNWYLDLDVPIHGMTYQIVQETEKNIEIYLVQGMYQLTPSQLNRINESMYQLIPRDMNVSINIVDAPPIVKGTKYRPVISLLND